MRIIDTHLHLVYLDKFRYPWLDGVAPLNRQWDFPLYWSEANGLGIDRAIHMEVDVLPRQAEDEVRFALGTDSHVVAAVTAARPEELDFPAHLERILAEPRIKGIRRLLQNDADELSRGDIFRDNLRRLAPHGLTFDICVLPHQLEVARELVEACPEVHFVLDHCGNPPIPDGDLAKQGADFAAWRSGIDALAALPNVAGKISGIVNHAPAGWTPETLRPAVEHIIERFGWDRVVFGSDRPVVTLNGTLTQWVEALRNIVGDVDTSDQAKLFSGNAERIYRLS